MCVSKRFLFLAFLFSALLPAFTFAADPSGGPRSKPDTTAQLPAGSPSETPSRTQPTPSSQSLTDAWRLLKAELTEQGLDSERLLQQLEASQIEIEEARRCIVGLTARLSNLESSIQSERAGAETAIRTSLEREASALREAAFWRVGGIILAVVGLGALAASYFLAN